MTAADSRDGAAKLTVWSAERATRRNGIDATVVGEGGADGNMWAVGTPEDREAVPALTGRDAHIAVIGSALADIRSTGTSVLLRGDPGMGETALLRVAEAAARRAGLRVLRMTGAEAESGLPFAALHQVLWPFARRHPGAHGGPTRRAGRRVGPA